jgi:acyl carrier protein
MTPDQARAAVLASLAEIAPDADIAALSGDSEIRSVLDLDSMDVFNLVAMLSEQTGVDIPDAVLPRLTTLDAFVEHLVAADHGAASSTSP